MHAAPFRQVASPPWEWRRLLLAPHRLAFAGAAWVLVASSLWWLLIQWSRTGALPPWAVPVGVVSPTLVHGGAMVFGFAPLFFAGFLFTAGPKWLQVAPPQARSLVPGTLLQCVGWPVWLLGAHASTSLAVAGGALAWVGWCLHQWRFWGLLRASQASDRIHAQLVGTAGVLGLVSLAGLLLAVANGWHGWARAWTLNGLWTCAVLVYVTVAHRMIPFFTASALPMVRAWRPRWVLVFLVIAVVHKSASVWLDALALDWPVWRVASSFWMLVTGLVLLWLAFVWGLVQSLRIRLLAMLHIGFLWLALGFLLDASGHFWTLLTGEPSWSLGAMHATTMGFLGSLLVAMVTRVSCGHGGRALVADRGVWALFLLLQCATLVRVAATVVGMQHYALLTAVSATLWLCAMAPWALRLASWYGRPRADGQPG